MTNTCPNRDNWRQFCNEPPLSDAEWSDWRAMSAAVHDDDAAMTALIHATEAEDRAMRAIPASGDWGDMVALTDAARKLRRAEVAWWRGRGE